MCAGEFMYFKNIKIHLVSIAALLVTACVARTAYIPDSSLSRENSAIVTIYRPYTAYHSLNPEKPFVYIDEKEIGKLGVGEELTIKVMQGPHRFSIREPILFQPSYETRAVNLMVNPGQTYYLRYSEEMDGVIPAANGAVFTSSKGFDMVPSSIGVVRR